MINHLIRKFSEPLAKEGLQQVYRSTLLNDSCKEVKEHLLLGNVILNKLLLMDLERAKYQIAQDIHKHLTQALVIVYITEAEGAKLNQCGYQRSMPSAFFESEHPLFYDKRSRYKCAGIYANIKT